MDDKELYSIIAMFRTSIEEYKGIPNTKDEYDIDINDIMSKFPKTCCSIVSKFLGHYLKYDLKLSHIISCVGRFNDGGHHEWIKYKDKIIDITLDQFGTKYPKILITFKSEFHENKFSSIKEGKGLFEFKHWSVSYIKYYEG